MATGALISVEDYLRTSYRPDCDYVDGEIRERNLGESSHGRLQLRIGVWLYPREAKWRIRAMSEVRLQINPRRFRVPDIMVLSSDAPREEIVVTSPLLCIEIMSRRDTLDDLIRNRIQDYFSIGVPVCWVIDPLKRLAWVATPGHLTEATVGILRAGEIEMPLAEVLEPPAA